MAIKKTKVNGKILYEVFVKGRDENGKQRGLRRRGITSEHEARSIEVDLLVELKGLKKKVSWQKWVEHFLVRYKLEYRNSTYVNYKHTLEKWANPYFKNRLLDELSTHDIHGLVHNHVKGVSSYTRWSILKIVRRVFSMAVEEGILVRNPAVGIKVKAAEATQLVLNSNEIGTLLREARAVEHRFYYHWAFAILTGMRSGEMHSLRWTDIDLVSGFINISKSWTRRNGVGPTKTSKNRVCPISSECRRLLQELKLKSSSEPHVLPRLWEWDQGAQGKVLKDFCRGIGITPVRFHDLRATFITQMLNNGAPLSKVMAIVGHSSLKTTQGYLRLCGKDVEGATEALAVTLPRDEGGDGKVIALKR